MSRLALYSGPRSALWLTSTWYVSLMSDSSPCHAHSWPRPLTAPPTGVFVGWVCVSDQPYTDACAGSHDNWTILSQNIRSLLLSEITDRVFACLFVCVCILVRLIPSLFRSTQVYCLGTILSMQISFVGFQPVQSSEHMAVWGMGVWEYECMKIAHKPACHLLSLVGGV